MSKFSDDFHALVHRILDWFGVEESHVVTFLKPVVAELAAFVEKGLLTDVIEGVPVVAEALTHGTAAALEAAQNVILPQIEKQGVTLGEEALAILAQGLVANARKSLSNS